MSATDSWMPLYVGPFLADTTHLSNEMLGAYLKLMLGAWTRGGKLPENDEQLARIAGVSITEWPVFKAALQPFFEVRDGYWIQRRLFKEKEKATKNLATFKLRATKAANARWSKKQASVKDASSMHEGMLQEPTSTSTLKPPHTAKEPEHFIEAVRPTLNEVLTKAQFIGLAEWKARDWFEEMQGCGWRDYNNRTVQNWEAVLNRVKTKWEADGRPKSPPTNVRNGSSEKLPLWRQLEILQEDLSKHPVNRESTYFCENFTQAQKNDYDQKKLKLKELRAKGIS